MKSCAEKTTMHMGGTKSIGTTLIQTVHNMSLVRRNTSYQKEIREEHTTDSTLNQHFMLGISHSPTLAIPFKGVQP